MRRGVQESVHDKFADVLADRVKGIRQGNGLDSGVDMGPCINQGQADFAQTHVDDAVSKGAKVLRTLECVCACDTIGCSAPLMRLCLQQRKLCN